MSKPQLLTKGFFIVSFINFFIVVNYYLLIVTLSVYAMGSFKSSPGEAGFTSSVFIIGVLIGRLWSGRWIERIGRKKTLYIGLFIGLVMALMYFKVSNIWLLFAARFFNGVGFGISSTSTGTVITNFIPGERRGEGIGYYALSGTFGTAVGPFLGMLMIRGGHFNLVFLADAAFAAICLLLMFFLAVPDIKLTQEQLQEIKEFKFTGFFETRAIPISIFNAVAFSCYASILTFLPAYAREIQVVDAASIFFVVFSAAVFISRPISGRLFDAKGENFVIYPAILIFMTGVFLVSQTHLGYTLLLAGALIGLGLGTVQSSSQAVAVKVTPKHRTGLAMSTFFLVMDTGIGIGPLIFGLLIPLSSYRTVYAGAAVVVLACVYLYYLLHGKKARAEKKTLSGEKVLHG